MTDKTKLAEALEKILKIADHAFKDPKLRSDGARALKRCADIAEAALTPCEGEGDAAAMFKAIKEKLDEICPEMEVTQRIAVATTLSISLRRTIAPTPIPVFQTIIERLEGEKKESFPQSYYPNEKSFMVAEEQKKIHNAALDRAIDIIKEVGGV